MFSLAVQLCILMENVSTVKKYIVTKFHKTQNGFSVDIFQFFLRIKQIVCIQINLETNLFGSELFIPLDIHLFWKIN